MIPIVTPDEMAAVDRATPEPVGVLIDRAGAAVARQALGLLGGGYGRRVVVVAGKGNNGADGRAAAARLRRRGVRGVVLDAKAAPARLPAADLVIDAAYGTGFRGEYAAPDPGAAPVLAVDIPSGVDGLTGAAGPGAVDADGTVTFAALKPGLLFLPGRALTGPVTVADIGLDATTTASACLVEASDVGEWLPERPIDTHKWQAAVWVIGGSPGMTGAALLSCRGAQRSGAGYVRLCVPGAEPGAVDAGKPVEVVATTLPEAGWAGAVLDGIERFKALIVGPGLGRDVPDDVQRVVASSPVPTVVDGDGLHALGAEAGRYCRATTILTPHDGEYAALAGHRPGPDRLAAARDLAGATGAVVLLKGPTTVVAQPDGRAYVAVEGSEWLATAGTGDVLAGVIGALCATGLDPFRAAAAAAFVHGRASRLGFGRGLTAGDLPDLLPVAFEKVET